MVTSDIEMPGMDGSTLVRTIRENPAFRDLKIMLHSSMSNPTNQIKATQVGADDFVAKFDPIFLRTYRHAMWLDVMTPSEVAPPQLSIDLSTSTC